MSTETLPLQQDTRQQDYRRRALDVFIHVGLVVLLATACLAILRPFLPLIAWGIVIAIATYPAYKKLRGWVGGRGNLAAVLCTLAFLAVLIVPVILLAETMIEGVGTLSAQLKRLVDDGTNERPAWSRYTLVRRPLWGRCPPPGTDA